MSRISGVRYIYEVTDILKKRHKDSREVKVLAIGQVGEKLADQGTITQQ